MPDFPGNFTTNAEFERTATIGTFSGALESTGDVDWIKVSLTFGTTYRFFISGQGENGSDIQPFAVLLDGNGVLVAVQGSGVIQFTPADTGVYFLEIVPGSTTFVGAYNTFFSTTTATNEQLGPFDDIYVAVANNARVLGGAGNDTISMGAATQGLDAHGEAGNDAITGNSNSNDLTGGLGNDTIFGGGGAFDEIFGDAGNDRLFGEAGADTMFGGDGNDFLDGGDQTDNLKGGAGNDTVLGGANNDFIEDTAGNDVLDGGKGDDQVFGGAGNDIYFVDTVADLISETFGSGVDTVRAALSFSLLASASVKGSFENLILIGVEDFNGTGNALANTITGNSGKNILNGGSGNDRLDGRSGNDTLIGGLGNDVLTGQLGTDTATGGAGNDTFRYLSRTESKLGILADVIRDFDDSGNDRIDVGALFGRKMTYLHDDRFTAAGQVRINDVVGTDVIVEINTGGSLAADFAMRLKGTTLASMTASDFVL